MKGMSRTWKMLNIVAMIALGTLSLAGCKKSAEGEIKKWGQNTGFLDKYTTEYPSMKSVIEKHRADSTSLHEAAMKESGDKKIEGLAAANDKARTLINPFQSYEASVKEAASLKKDRTIMKLPASRVNPAIQRANSGLSKARSILAAGPIESSEAAIEKLKEARSAVKSGLSSLKRLKSKAKKKKKKKKKKTT